MISEAESEAVQIVRRFNKLKSEMDKALAEQGPVIIKRLCQARSLGSLALASDLSVTYLSLVSRGLVTISPGAFIKLAKVRT